MAKRYREKAIEQYEKHLSIGQYDLLREGRLATRLYRKNMKPHLPLDRAARILDLGCGFGLFLDFLRSEGYKNATGVDACRTNVKICESRGHSVSRGDNQAFLEQHPQEFDCIHLNYVLEHYDKEEALRLLEAVNAGLNPAGTILIMAPNMGNPITATRNLYMDITHEVSYTEESMRQILLLAGFQHVSVYPVDQYCLSNPILNFLGGIAGQFMFAALRVIYLLNGVRTTRIYTKSLLAVARK
jgi:2-polyprenyl-3-methyl-5-hydroxy-6-metoxy-1,4-benzoquinol methylase